MMVKLTVYFRENLKVRSLSGTYTRNQAALRLKWARKQEDFRGYKLEAI